MKRTLAVITFFIASSAYGGISEVDDAKITRIDFYGSQFSVHLDKSHASGGCGGSLQVVALDSTTEVGKAHMSALLAAWLAQKNVYFRVSDLSGKCNGDRPTIVNWSAY